MVKRDFLSLEGLTKDQLDQLVQDAILLKKERAQGLLRDTLKGKSIAMLFEKPSTRTLVSFDVAIYELGGHTVTLPSSSLGGREAFEDIANTLNRYVSGIVIRTFHQDNLEKFSRAANIPVINALSDKFHPCQILADYQTIIEHKGNRHLKIAYLGDGFNIANTLLQLCSIVGYDINIATPVGYEPHKDHVEAAKLTARKTGSKIIISNNPYEAVQDADIIYTDTWTSMGLEEESHIRIPLFQHYQVNAHLLAEAKTDTRVMHCLPAHRGQEITNEVMDGPQSIVFDQAENRLHSQKAILLNLFA
jgi:ornithine carbamoyltransferase